MSQNMKKTLCFYVLGFCLVWDCFILEGGVGLGSFFCLGTSQICVTALRWALGKVCFSFSQYLHRKPCHEQKYAGIHPAGWL